MNRRNKSKGDVEWYAPNSKKPIAYSTKAAGLLIVALSHDGTPTIQQVYDSIVFDVEAKAVLAKYIDLGYQNEIAKMHFY